ncbi:hypothetical protein GY45DRAFT_1265446 [Cubamyces sp. BRFM 1775]|nr:hypothetical protein GY45DRAFT_1265446 [Cubamyces sp. BRFM 1775]
MLKRPRDAFDTPDSSSPPLPASKRRYTSSSLAGSSPSTVHSVTLSTPYTLPYFRSPFSLSVPHDSPSNPFGLNRALRALTLPRPTGFSKHIVLRMQLVSTSNTVASTRARKGSRRNAPADPPYRVVQVPLNYSFRLLHMLVLFLFASDARLRVRRRKGLATRSLRAREAASSSTSGKEVDISLEDDRYAQGEGHLFEVLEDIRLYTNTYRPGVIKMGTGRLYAKLSSSRERKLFPEGPQSHRNADDDVFGGASMSIDDPVDEDDEGWDWEAEDDFLLSNVWADGPDLKKGIIYHHTPTTAVHITVNQTRVPARKGIGNTPYVFNALGGTAGAVRMSNVAAFPCPPSSSVLERVPVSTRKPNRKRRRRSRDVDTASSSSSRSSSSNSCSSSDSDSDAPEENSTSRLDDGEEVPDLEPHEEASEDQLERWNAHNAFERFLKREAARERAMRRHHPAADPSTQGQHVRSATAPLPGPSRISKGRDHRVGVPSSPALGRNRTHTYGRPHRYGFKVDPDDMVELGIDNDDPADILPPSSPSTLPIAFPSDYDGVWTDTDGEYSSGRYADVKREDEEEEGLDESARENMRYMIELPLQTPFPAHPALRRRVRRASERMERQVSKGLSEMSDGDEEEKEAEDNQKGASEDGTKEDVKGKGKAPAADLKADKVKAAAAPGKENADVGDPKNMKDTRPRSKPAHCDAAKPKRRGLWVFNATFNSNANDDEPENVDQDAASDGSMESVEVDGFLVPAAPWLGMRGPEDASGEEGTGVGDGWDSEEEI